jgi:protein-disulfide isomerase
MSANHLKLCCALLFVAAVQSPRTAVAAECPPLSKDIAHSIESYLTQRLVSGTGAHVSVTGLSVIPENCYRKITIRISGQANEGVMYLSPDERFLTSTLYDLNVSPEEEVTRIAANVNQLLMRDQSPHLTGASATLTVVEFGDLECPYTKLFADWFHDLPDTFRDRVNLVFKHLPLRQHPWARTGAIYSACAGLQSPSAFWLVSDALLQHQSEVTTETLKGSVLAELSKLPALNVEKLLSCATTGDGNAVVDRDLAVAEQLAVVSTPTLFINGRRALTPRSKAELQQLLEVELARLSAAATSAEHHSR